MVCFADGGKTVMISKPPGWHLQRQSIFTLLKKKGRKEDTTNKQQPGKKKRSCTIHTFPCVIFSLWGFDWDETSPQECSILKINYSSFSKRRGQGLVLLTLETLHPCDEITSLVALTLPNGTSVIFTKWYLKQSDEVTRLTTKQSHPHRSVLMRQIIPTTTCSWRRANQKALITGAPGSLSRLSGQGHRQLFVLHSDFITHDQIRAWMFKQQVTPSPPFFLPLFSFLPRSRPLPVTAFLLNARMLECELSL